METSPGQGQTTTTSTDGEFGASEYGERLSYDKPEYKDIWAMVAFYLMMLTILIITIYFWAVLVPELVEDAEDDTDTSNAKSDSETEEDSDTSGIWVILIASLLCGVLFGLMWLQCMKVFAKVIIKVLLFCSIGFWFLLAVIGFATGLTGFIVLGIIFGLIACLYTWCVWRRIPFASVCLSISSNIVMHYPGTIWCSLMVVFFNFIWYIIWIFAFWAYIIIGNTNVLYSFLLLICLYWGVNVWRNVSHTTTCGVAATWFFNSGVLDRPVSKAFKRTMTTSFGSVCFGSLIVAVLQAIRAMLRGSKRGCGCLICIIECILMCIERMVRYFNTYAFAQCAIYGSSFIQSAKATWAMFMSRGISALINDDLTGLALTCGAILGAIVSLLAALFIGLAFYPHLDVWTLILLCIIAAILGYYACLIILLVVRSGVVTIFVCFCEDPHALSVSRPDEFRRLTEASTEFSAMSGRGGHAQPAAQQVAMPVQQMAVQPQTQFVDQFGNPVAAPPQQTQFVDQNGNPVAAPQTQFVDQFGNPVQMQGQPQTQFVDQFGRPVQVQAAPAPNQ